VGRAAEVTGREVVLVDDVYTTGTTVVQRAGVRRRAGPSRVWGAPVARRMKPASKNKGFEWTGAAEPSFTVSEVQAFEVEGELEVRERDQNLKR